MKATEVIPYGVEIIEGKSQFFITERDITYKNVTIFKDSLVMNDGERIQVNRTGLGMLSSLVEKNKRKYIFEKVSECPFELNELNDGGTFIWHNNHFDDYFAGDYSNYFDRINQGPVLQFGEISFSSFIYHLNYKKNILEHFINTKYLRFDLGSKSINLPKDIIISRNVGESEIYSIIPIKKKEGFKINEILFKDGRINEDATFIGGINERIKVRTKKSREELTLPKGVELIIDSGNNIKIGEKIYLLSNNLDPNLSGLEIEIVN